MGLCRNQTCCGLRLLLRLLLLRGNPKCIRLLLLLPPCLLLLHQFGEARKHPLLLGTAGRRVAAAAARGRAGTDSTVRADCG